MHDPRHAAAGRRLERENGPAAALGDEVVLEVLGERRIARDLAQSLGQLAAALAQLATQAAQHRRSRVLQVGAVLLDRSADLLGDREQRDLDAGGELLQRGEVVARRQRAASGCTGPDRPLDQREAPRVERAAACRALGCVGHVGDATEIRLGRIVEQRDRLGRLLLAQVRPRRVGRRPQALGEQRAGLARRCRGQPGQHGRQLQQFEVVLAHEASVRRLRSVARPSGASYDLRVRYRESLPQLNGSVLLTDGGMETTLIFVDGLDLPCFASFPLLERDDGRAAMDALLRAVPRGRAPSRGRLRARGEHLAREPSWGAQLGYSLDDLAEANRRAVRFVAKIRDREEAPGRPIVLSAPIGPEGDAYDPESRMTADEAEAYHSWQAGVLADTAADIVTALTITYVEEAIGIVRAATKHGLPVAVSFTVETDGRLPTGQSLAEAIEQVDAETDAAPAYFMVNCAHPTHFLSVLDGPGPWHRVLGIRANASTKSHAELDESDVLDDGDPLQLARGVPRDRRAAPAPDGARRLLRHRSPPRRERRGRLVRRRVSRLAASTAARRAGRRPEPAR